MRAVKVFGGLKYSGLEASRLRRARPVLAGFSAFAAETLEIGINRRGGSGWRGAGLLLECTGSKLR
jgi:hypothetical protein